MNLRNTIKKLTKKDTIMGQCLSAVGYVNNTIHPKANIMELPCTDVAGAGIAAGYALKKPLIFVIRFGDFIWLNSSMLINYAGKCKELFNKDCNLFVRCLTNPVKGIGPVHSGTFHNLFMHIPGWKVAAPITPKEYEEVYRSWKKDKCPYFVSEDRTTFNNKKEIKDIFYEDAQITIFGIGGARMKCIEAIKQLKKEKIKCNFVNLMWLKGNYKKCRFNSDILVVDNGYTLCGAAQSIACELNEYNKEVNAYALGQGDHHTRVTQDAGPTVEDIKNKVKEILN